MGLLFYCLLNLEFYKNIFLSEFFELFVKLLPSLLLKFVFKLFFYLSIDRLIELFFAKFT